MIFFLVLVFFFSYSLLIVKLVLLEYEYIVRVTSFCYQQQNMLHVNALHYTIRKTFPSLVFPNFLSTIVRKLRISLTNFCNCSKKIENKLKIIQKVATSTVTANSLLPLLLLIHTQGSARSSIYINMGHARTHALKKNAKKWEKYKKVAFASKN